MSGEPSTACRRSARLAAKRAEAPRVDEDGATSSRPAVEDDALAGPSGCQPTAKKRNATGKSTRVAQPAKKLKTVQEDEVVEKAQTKQDHAQRATRHLEDAEKPKRGRRTTLAKTSSKREEVVASKPPATAKRQGARAELASSGPSRQAKKIRRRSRSTSRGSYHTAEEIASDAGSTTPEQEDHTLPTPPVVEADSRFDRLRRVWRWLSSNDGIQSGVQNEG